MNVAQAIATEPLNDNAQPFLAAQTIGVQPEITPILADSNEPVCCERVHSASTPSESTPSEPTPREVAPSEPIKGLETHVDELAAVGKVLQLLEHQLHGVNRDVEESVAGVCCGFHGMAQRAQAAVASARSATVGTTQASDAISPLDEMHQVLETLLVAVQSSCIFSQTAAEQLSQLERRLASVEKIVSEVEDIAGRAKMVALNGRIEASRLGVAGKAFGVVAQETKDLADKAGKTGCSIRQSINELATELSQTTAEMRRRAESDVANFEQTNSAVHQLLAKVEQTHRQTNTAMATTVGLSVELQGDIGKAVMSMQFQDRVSQRVAHVVETLAGLVERIDPWCAEANAIEAQSYFDSWQAEMASRYTMDSERNTVGEARSQNASSAETTDNFSVELF